MTGMAAVTEVGERLVALLREGRDVTASYNVALLSTAQIATPPAEGVAVTCYHLAQGQDRIAPPVRRDGARVAPAIMIDLHFLVAASSLSVGQELEMIAAAMLALAAKPVLTSIDWPEPIHLVTAETAPEDMFQLWRALGAPYRPGFVVIASGLRLSAARSGGAPPILTGPFGG